MTKKKWERMRRRIKRLERDVADIRAVLVSPNRFCLPDPSGFERVLIRAEDGFASIKLRARDGDGAVREIEVFAADAHEPGDPVEMGLRHWDRC